MTAVQKQQHEPSDEERSAVLPHWPSIRPKFRIRPVNGIVPSWLSARASLVFAIFSILAAILCVYRLVSTSDIRNNMVIVTTDQIIVLSSPDMNQVMSVDAPFGPDAVLSPDGTRLYATGIDGIDSFTAYDVASGDALWSTVVKHRTNYIDGIGPSSLAISLDGRYIYILSSGDDSASDDPTAVVQWIQVVSGESGDIIGTSQLVKQSTSNPCVPTLIASEDAGTLYFVCQEKPIIYMLDAKSLRILDMRLAVGGSAVIGAVATPSRKVFYVVSTRSDRMVLSTIDTNRRAVDSEVTIDSISPTIIHPTGSVGLSGDGTVLAVATSTGRSGVELHSTVTVTLFDAHSWRYKTAPATLDSQVLDGRAIAISYDGAYLYGSASTVDSTSTGVPSHALVELNTSTGNYETVVNVTGELRRVVLGQ